jgi:hypothetical protein
MIIAGADHSTSWRRAIERGDHDFNPGTRDAIASAIRDALATAVSVGADAIDLVAVLRRYSWSIFRRLVLHLARSEAIADEYVSQLLIDSDAISDRSLDFERRRLAHDRFRSLTGPQQQDYLGVIEQGPDLEPYEAWSIARQGRQMLADERRSVVEEWQRDELTFIADHLPTDWRVRYDGIVARVGEPSVFVLDPHPQVSVGAPSPFAMEELQAMSIEELVATVAEWHPQLGYRGTLAYQLTPLVSGSSDAFSARAMDLAVLPAEHLAAVVRGFGAALQEGTPLQWDQLLLLAANIAERVENDEQEWRWVKQEVLRLLIAAVGKQPPALGLVRRNDVFSVVARCGLDGDPSPETEEQLAGNGDLARTSVRGLSIEAMVQYGTWVRRFDPEDALSELFEFFEQHLDPAVDPSPTVRTMYGRWLANLCWLDASWVADQLGSLFPHDPEHRNLWLGVWTGFLWPSAQWTTLDRLLLDEFEFARSLMDSASTDRNQNGRDAQLLALVQRLVYQGVIEASHPLVDATFSGASEKAKRETLTMIGHQLRQQATTLDDAVRDRLMSLWERRETAIEAGAPAHELRAFCAWFASGRFPPEWALAKLEHALRQAGSSEGVHLVVERLAALVEELPGPVLRCLELLVEEGNEPWFFETWEEPARVVLSASLVAEDETLHRLAAGIINKATARGNLAWRDLLHDEREG